MKVEAPNVVINEGIPVGLAPVADKVRRFRLHRSTVVVLLIGLTAFVAANLPYKFDGPPDHFHLRFLSVRNPRLANSMPLTRSLMNVMNRNFRHAGWPQHFYFTEANGETFWEWKAGTFDLLFAISVLGIGGAIFEWRRRRRRSWMHLSMADLLLFVVIAAPALAWHRARVVQHQRTRAAAISISGRAALNVTRTQIVSLPAWISRFVPDSVCEPLNSITRLDLRQPTPEVMRELGEFQQLRSLSLRGDLRRIDLSTLSTLASLEELFIEGSLIDDSQVEAIEKLPSLRFVSLANSTVSDNVIGHLAKVRNLEGVDLRATRVSAEKVESLRSSCPRLRIVDY